MIDLNKANISMHSANRPERPLVIAYYTRDTPYAGEAEHLKLSLEAVGYSFRVVGLDNRGSWQKNTQMKAEFIHEMLQCFPNMPLLYLDVDAVMIIPAPILDGLKADIAAVHFAKQSELLSGTLFLGNTSKCNEIVDRWIRINHDHPKTLPNGKQAWDQRTLQLAINRTDGVNFVELPQEYTWITELTQRHAPGLQPVIMHTRGAKRFKNIINGKRGYAE